MLALPIAPKNARGTLITSAQGQETTKNTNARYTQIDQTPGDVMPTNIGGTIAKSNAQITTMGV
jgi:hypothetical protein